MRVASKKWRIIEVINVHDILCKAAELWILVPPCGQVAQYGIYSFYMNTPYWNKMSSCRGDDTLSENPEAFCCSKTAAG